jgi:hypothetical protein
VPIHKFDEGSFSLQRVLYRWIRRLPTLLFLLISACAPDSIRELIKVDSVLARLGPTQNVLRIAAILGGLFLMLAGRKIYRYVVAMPGFLVGATAGVQLAHNFTQGNLWLILGLLFGGFLGAWLALTLHDIAIFVIGAIGGIYIANLVWNLLSPVETPLYVDVIGAIFGGVALSGMAKIWMTLLSAAAGATMVAWGANGGILVVIFLFVVGLGAQYGFARAAGEDVFEEPSQTG